MKLRKDRILGVDPGTNILGFGIIEIKEGLPIVLDANVLNLKEEIDQQSKLREIFLRIQEIIEAYSTGIMAVEAPFYAKNPQSMLKLGRAQGVAIAAAMVMGLDIQEFSPKKIKKSITGNGNASKEQVNLMIQSTLKYQFQTKYLDASDALATALCAFYQNQNPIADLNSKGGWEKFIKQNQDRIIKY